VGQFFLSPINIIDACLLSVLTGAHFVKTSTGFSSSGAKLSDVQLMKEVVGDSALVKASGSIRDYATAKLMADNGASRLGVSAGVAILQGEQQQQSVYVTPSATSRTNTTNTY